MTIESNNFHLSAVLDQVHSITAEAASRKGLTVEVDHNAVPFWLRGDATRMRQALLNFAGNAVKFTQRGCVVSFDGWLPCGHLRALRLRMAWCWLI